jgi:ribonuclease HII
VIDRIGIQQAIKRALNRCLTKLGADPRNTLIVLDGGLYAPTVYMQRTIIRGDATIPVIAYASIVAKVTRDNYMKRMAKKYPQYGFERHVGYGTEAHIRAIKRYGITPLHRESFLTRII